MSTNETGTDSQTAQKPAFTWPGGEFTVKEISTKTGVSGATLQFRVQQGLKNGELRFVSEVKAVGRGRPSKVYSRV